MHAKLEAQKHVTPENVAERWWTEPELVGSQPEAVTLLFRDATANYEAFGEQEIWADEAVEASADEPVLNALLRFRVRTNRKYRHPFRPTLNFDVVLPGAGEAAPERVNINDCDALLLKDVLSRLGAEPSPVVRYVRNDRRNMEADMFTINSVPSWKRELPGWFPPAPASWLTPAPPRSFADPSVVTENGTIVYKQAPLLHYPGNGRNILPGMAVPPAVATHLYVPVHAWGETTTYAMLGPEDCVLLADRLVLPLTDEQARSVLGRTIQFSTAPLPDDSRADGGPPAKRRKKQAGGRRTGLPLQTTAAWGYDPAARVLHCTHPAGWAGTELLLDVGEPGWHCEYGASRRDAFAVNKHHAYWLGVVSSPEDRRLAAVGAALQGPGEGGASREQEGEVKKVNIDALAASLNVSEATRVFEVLDDDEMLLGDVQLAKGDLDFECVIEGLKPGVWRSAVSVADDDRFTEVRLLWTMPGRVDYGAPAALASDTIGGESGEGGDGAGLWEKIGSYSIDSGSTGAIMRSVLDGDVLTDDDIDVESALEMLMDLALDGNVGGGCPAVPGGVVFMGDDGDYAVLGRKDGQGSIVAVAIRTPAFSE